MSNPFDFFDKIYCINLLTDHERKSIMQNQFKNLGISERINWVSSPRPHSGYYSSNYKFAGEFGVVRSQLKAVTNSLSSEVVNGIAIFEDDVLFDKESLSLLQETLDNLPKDWDILYLGGRPLEKVEKVIGNIYKVNKFTSAMSYCISAKSIHEYVAHYIDSMGQRFPDACCDNILNDFILRKGKRGYVMYPNLTSTIPGESTLRNDFRDYRPIFDAHWKKYL